MQGQNTPTSERRSRTGRRAVTIGAAMIVSIAASVLSVVLSVPPAAAAGLPAAGLPAADTAVADMPAACPAQPTRVVRSAGGDAEYRGSVPGIPELCRIQRPDGAGAFYFGIWRSDWPGAGEAYPALWAAITGPKGTRTEFVTRSVPGMQWLDSFVNEGVEPLVVAGQTYQVLKLAHERQGIEGNTYHSIITSWRDVETGITLKTAEFQIAGQSYGPNTTWHAIGVTPIS